MSILNSLLRKKRLLLAEVARQLHQALALRDAAAKALAAAEGEHREARQYLVRQLFDEESLCVQRLAAAKLDEGRTEILMEHARAAHQEHVNTAESLEQRGARLQKDIEKLDEKRVERGLAKQEGARAAEWVRLDEWVVTRHGVKDLDQERAVNE